MALQLSVCPFRLLFKHPFETAHGLRDGTDSLFVRVEEDEVLGNGEITLPPYVNENVAQAWQRLSAIASHGDWTLDSLLAALDTLSALRDAPATRAGLHMALVDAMAKRNGHSVAQELGGIGPNTPLVLMTIGICEPGEALDRSATLPPSTALKLKAGDELGIKRIQVLTESTSASVLIDGNQGFRSVDQAAEAVQVVPRQRLLGIEQPFKPEHDAWNRELAERTGAMVIADESLQDSRDLERVAKWFGGINIKLMKCGGLDRALDLIRRARELNLDVMLGCMSESSLGCTAMAQLAGQASLVDLDGPWLLSNDPWKGLQLKDGHLTVPRLNGLCVEPRIQFDFVDA